MPMIVTGTNLAPYCKCYFGNWILPVKFHDTSVIECLSNSTEFSSYSDDDKFMNLKVKCFDLQSYFGRKLPPHEYDSDNDPPPKDSA
jgi:hypothetical protein